MSGDEEKRLVKVKTAIASDGHQVRSAPGAPGYAIFNGRDECVKGCPGYTLTLADLEAWAAEQDRDTDDKDDEDDELALDDDPETA